MRRLFIRLAVLLIAILLMLNGVSIYAMDEGTARDFLFGKPVGNDPDSLREWLLGDSDTSVLSASAPAYAPITSDSNIPFDWTVLEKAPSFNGSSVKEEYTKEIPNENIALVKRISIALGAKRTMVQIGGVPELKVEVYSGNKQKSQEVSMFVFEIGGKHFVFRKTIKNTVYGCPCLKSFLETITFSDEDQIGVFVLYDDLSGHADSEEFTIDKSDFKNVTDLSYLFLKSNLFSVITDFPNRDREYSAEVIDIK